MVDLPEALQPSAEAALGGSAIPGRTNTPGFAEDGLEGRDHRPPHPPVAAHESVRHTGEILPMQCLRQTYLAQAMLARRGLFGPSGRRSVVGSHVISIMWLRLSKLVERGWGDPEWCAVH